MVGRNLEALLWWVGPWKSAELDAFIDEFAPDLLFVPLYSSAHMNRLTLHLRERTGAPLVAYVSDDVYSLRRLSISPLFWARRIGSRRLIRQVIRQCDRLYVISDSQKVDYSEALGVECSVLTKLGDFSGLQPPAPDDTARGDQIVFTYAGNVGNGRWKSLCEIGRALDRASETGHSGRLDIYTMTPLSRRMRRSFNCCRSIRLHSAVSPDKLRRVFEESDILVLVEPTDVKGRQTVRHSFSTKIVEYLEAGRPILLRAATGQASANYLKMRGAAMVSTPRDDLEQQVQDLMTDRELRLEFARNGWNLGRENHNLETELPKLESYLKRLAGESPAPRPDIDNA